MYNHCHFKYNVTWRKGPNIPVYKNTKMMGRYYEDFKIDRGRGLSNYTQVMTEHALEYITR